MDDCSFVFDERCNNDKLKWLLHHRSWAESHVMGTITRDQKFKNKITDCRYFKGYIIS